MPSFQIDRRFQNQKDVLKTFNWELTIPQINKVMPTSFPKLDDLVIRVRSASMPSRGLETIESSFHGMRQFFSGRMNFGHTLEVTFEEFEDQKILKGFYEWSQKIFNVDPNSPVGGSSEVSGKRNYAVPLIIKQFNSDDSLADTQVEIINAWPENISDSSLDYTTSDSVKYSVTFRFDYWVLRPAKA